jgi:hypothetical protein
MLTATLYFTNKKRMENHPAERNKSLVQMRVLEIKIGTWRTLVAKYNKNLTRARALFSIRAKGALPGEGGITESLRNYRFESNFTGITLYNGSLIEATILFSTYDTVGKVVDCINTLIPFEAKLYGSSVEPSTMIEPNNFSLAGDYWISGNTYGTDACECYVYKNMIDEYIDLTVSVEKLPDTAGSNFRQQLNVYVDGSQRTYIDCTGVVDIPTSFDANIDIINNSDVDIQEVNGTPRAAYSDKKVIMYMLHHVTSEREGVNVNQNWVLVERLERVVSEAVKNGFSFPAGSDFVTFLGNPELAPAKQMYFVFDDGGVSWYELLSCRSLFNANNIKPIVAEIGNTIVSEDGTQTPAQLERANFLKKIRDIFGATITAHGYNHEGLSNVTYDKAIKEISTFSLFNKIGINPSIYVYPYGYFEGRVFDLLKHSGFSCAVSATESEGNYTNIYGYKYAMNRAGCEDRVPWESVKAMIN